MPRGPRLDAPGCLHHVIARGIERRPLFGSDAERTDLLTRIGAAARAQAWDVYAWALMPNHVHLLVRTGVVGLSATVQRILGGYASAFNRRHRRAGHLFQNRFKSIVVEEEGYFVELVRYIHANPVRAGILADAVALERYPWTGHATLLGDGGYAWQAVAAVLERFGPTPRDARLAYRAFVQAGCEAREWPDLSGGGLRRSRGGWRAVPHLQQGREHWAFDERILGSSRFVEEHLAEAAAATVTRSVAPAPRERLDGLLDDIARHQAIDGRQLASASKRPAAVHARALFCHHAHHTHGWSTTAIAHYLGVSRMSVHRALQASARGASHHGELPWCRGQE